VFNRELAECLSLESMLFVLKCIGVASLSRTESRGALYRRDFPLMDNTAWLKNSVISSRDGRIELRHEPVVITKITPPAGLFRFGQTE
jgi:succinate dehydrogenase/fumarate reductase flavoprotein subunit